MASEAAKRAVRDLFFAVDDDERAGVIQRVINDQTAPLRRAKKISDDAHAGLLKTVGELRALLEEASHAVLLCQTEVGMTFVECCLCGVKTELHTSPAVGPEEAAHDIDCLINRIHARLEAKP